MLQDQLIKLINNNQLSEDEKIAQLQNLITSEADLINLNEDKESLLHMAAQQGCMVVCQWLINNYSGLLAAKTIRGSSVLFYAAISGNEVLFDYIYASCPLLLNELTLKKRHVLFSIADSGNIKLFTKVAAQVPKEWLISKDSEHTFPISWAAIQGHVEVVLWILSQLHDQQDNYKEQFLEAVQVAAMQGHIDIIKELYVKHPDWLNIPIYFKYTPIHTAASYGKLSVVNFLLEKFPDAINELYDGKLRLIDLAAKSGNLELVKQLASRLANYPFTSLLNEPNPIGSYLLCYAVESGNVDLVEQLLKWGANINVQNKMVKIFANGDTLAHIAAQGGCIKVLALLQQYKAKIDEYNAYGLTPLHYAIIANNTKTIEWLLKHNASVKKLTFEDNSTAIHIAVIFGRYNLLDLLHAHGATLELTDNRGMYLLHLAAASTAFITCSSMLNTLRNIIFKDKNENKLNMSFAHKSDLELTTDYFYGHIFKKLEQCLGKPHLSTIFDQFVTVPDDKDYRKVMQWLLDHSVDAQQVTANTERSNACHIAAQAGQLENLIFLHEHNVPINCANASGNFPIHLASRYGHQSVVAWLLQQNIAVDELTHNSEAETPFIIAVKNNNLNLLDIFKEHQANIHLPNSGCFPLSFAIKKNQPEIVKWLLQNGARIDHPLAENFYALQLVAVFDSEECFDLLFTQPLQYWEQRDEYCHTPLTAALASNSSKVLKKLLMLHPLIDEQIKCIWPTKWQGMLHHTTAYGWQPIHYLSLIEMPETPAILNLTNIEEFLKHGINVNALTEEGETILHLLIKKLIKDYKAEKSDNYLRLISLLLRYGLNAHIRNVSDKTAYDYVFDNVKNNVSQLNVAELLLHIFHEHGININISAITNLLVLFPSVETAYAKSCLSFILNHFPELYTDVINALNKETIDSFVKAGLLPAYRTIEVKISQAVNVGTGLEGHAIQADSSFNPLSLETNDRIFLLKQLCAFIINPPSIFTPEMSLEAKAIFYETADVTKNQETINIISTLLDKAAITNTLTRKEEKKFNELYLKLYKMYYKKLPSLLELSADAVIRLPMNIAIDKKTKQEFHSHLTIIGSQFGRIRKNREYILDKFTEENIPFYKNS